jgi:hypothetical protein
MFLKSLSIVLAILLTASLVHNIHLEGLLRDKKPTAFYQEPQVEQVINQKVINNQPDNSIELLPPDEDEGQNVEVVDLNDILASNNNNPPNHSDALFGGVAETKTKKKRK